MTVALAWIATRSDGREHLYVASDSRVRGGGHMDACPKIITLPRSDAVLAFAGSTTSAYPLMLQVANSIAAHRPARDRTMDICQLKGHLVHVCTDLIGRFIDVAAPFDEREVQFLLAGFSWLTGDFQVWTIEFNAKKKRFIERAARTFHPRLRKAAFIGDRATDLRGQLARMLAPEGPPVSLEPLGVLAEMLLAAGKADTIGGPPQVVRVAKHMNTRCFVVRWQGKPTIFGRPLFPYESVDYWVLDPVAGTTSPPELFGKQGQARQAPGGVAGSAGPEVT